MKSIYSVPFVSQNLRQDEGIVQIADALRHLCNVSNGIFNRINKRIESNSEHLAALSVRINEVHNQVIKLANVKKSITVFSSSEYPGANTHQKFMSIFYNDERLPLTRTKIKFRKLQVNNEPVEETIHLYCHLPVLNNNINEKHQFVPKGLGLIPSDIMWVNDLFLYNTSRNSYKDDVSFNSLQYSFSKKKNNSIDVSTMKPAPLSISDRTLSNKSTEDSFLYSPEFRKVPPLDVPLNLPDLHGIANDLQYTTEHETSINPSIIKITEIPDLPLLEEILSLSNESTSLHVTPNFQSQPHMEVVQPQLHVVNNIKETICAEELIQTSTVLENLPKLDSPHNNLTKPISQAGGLTAKPKATEFKQTAVSRDSLMTALHLKLQLRRKGIANSTIKAQNVTIMDKISQLIPKPPTPTVESESTDNDDWDD